MKRTVTILCAALVVFALISGCTSRSKRVSAPPAAPSATTTATPSSSAPAPSKPAPTASTTASAPGTKPAQAKPALPAQPTAKDVLLASAKVYRAAKTLALRAVSVDTVTVGKKRESTKTNLDVDYARPSNLRLKMAQGKTYALMINTPKSGYAYDSKSNMYRKGPAIKDLAKMTGGTEQGLSTMALLAGMDMTKYVKGAKLVGSGNIGGVDCYIIEYKLPNRGVSGISNSERVWIAKKDLLIRKILTTGRASAAAVARQSKGGKGPGGPITITHEITSASTAVDVSLPSSTFSISPPKGAKPMPEQSAQRPQVPTPPDTTGKKVAFTIPDLNGKQVSLSSYRGKPVLVVFWTSLSPASKKGMVAIQKMQQGLQAKGVSTVAITLDSNKEGDEKFVKENGISFPVLMGYDAAANTARSFGVVYLPSIFVVDKNGVIQGKAMGEEPTAAIEGELAKVGIR